MNKETGSALPITAVLYLISLIDCSGAGSNGGAATPTATVTATVTGLEPSTRYYFAVNAFSGLSGPCSNEVSTVTPPSGDVSLAWDPVQDPTVSTYEVHYGKQPSPGPPGDCTYSDSMPVPAPS